MQTGAYNGRSMQLSRRHFLASASALPLLATPSITRTRPWYQRMRRCGEIDFDETEENINGRRRDTPD